MAKRFTACTRRSVALLLIVSSALTGCGGGAGTKPALPNAPKPASVPTSGVGGLPVAVEAGTVSLPTSVNLSLTSLTVSNSLDTGIVASSGAFSIAGYTTGPQMMIAANGSGTPVLFGFVGPGQTTISDQSTAQALAYYGLDVFLLPPDLQAKAMTLIPQAPGFSALTSTIDASLRANPNAFAAQNTAVINALATFVTSLATTTSPKARELAAIVRPRDEVIDPGTKQSGITAIQQPPTGFFLENTYRRRAAYFVDQTGYVQNGTFVSTSTSLTPSAIEIPPVQGVSSTVSTVVNTISGLVFGTLNSYTPVDTDPMDLPLYPGSSETDYEISVVGPGAHDNGPLSSSQASARNAVIMKFVVFDLFLPLMLSFIIPFSSINSVLNSPLASSATKDFINFVTTQVPAVAAMAEAGNIKGAIETAVQQVAQASTFRQGMLAFFGSLTPPGGPIINITYFNQAVVLNNVLKLGDAIIVSFDATVVGAAMLLSNNIDVFKVKITADKVVITPSSATVPNDGLQTFTVTVPSLSLSNVSLEYDYTNTANFGHLSDGLDGHMDNFASTRNVVTYTAEKAGQGTDTMTVQVKLIDNHNRDLLGQTSATVTVGGCGAGGITNGSFAQGFTCWTQGVVATGSFSGYPHFGLGVGNCPVNYATAASIDVPGGADGYVEQTFSVPLNVKTLTLASWGGLDSTTATVSMRLATGASTVLGTFTPPSLQSSETSCGGGAPLNESFNISAFAGQTAILRLEATSGGNDGTIAYFTAISMK